MGMNTNHLTLIMLVSGCHAVEELKSSLKHLSWVMLTGWRHCFWSLHVDYPGIWQTCPYECCITFSEIPYLLSYIHWILLLYYIIVLSSICQYLQMCSHQFILTKCINYSYCYFSSVSHVNSWQWRVYMNEYGVCLVTVEWLHSFQKWWCSCERVYQGVKYKVCWTVQYYATHTYK